MTFATPANLDELDAPPADHLEVEIPMGEFTAREWVISRQGQRWRYESRKAEVDADLNAFEAADLDTDRYYRAVCDHDNHECAIHTNKGRYQGAAARLLRWVDDTDFDPPEPWPSRQAQKRDYATTGLATSGAWPVSARTWASPAARARPIDNSPGAVMLT
ncbi:hypothetical protein [Curtobacterium flaccumfaciens]|uniref:hypothetical protein n=1 Tax=Curtobacterium flaccumfaciens TaxID=2035 RepID=UPI00112A4BC8|nr:hypothetical protein [Curtobacterium flaccumfaciens]TPG05102.1 hypothetical protein EAH85_14120 [Curtobacterium flaccumfaciens]